MGERVWWYCTSDAGDSKSGFKTLEEVKDFFDDKKLWFCGHSDGGSWSGFKNLKQVKDFFGSTQVIHHLPEKFNKLTVEVHNQDETTIYIWGEEECGFQPEEYGDYEGLKVVVDGKLVFPDLHPHPEDDKTDHEDCDICAH